MAFQNWPDMGYNLTCRANISSTNTKQIWKDRAATGNYFVVLTSVSTKLSPDYPRVDFPGADTAFVFGRLITVDGTINSSTDDEDFLVTVEIVGSAMVTGAATGSTALTNAQYNAFVHIDVSASRLLTIPGTALTNGNIRVIGGNQTRMVVIWNGFIAA